MEILGSRLSIGEIIITMIILMMIINNNANQENTVKEATTIWSVLVRGRALFLEAYLCYFI